MLSHGGTLELVEKILDEDDAMNDVAVVSRLECSGDLQKRTPGHSSPGVHVCDGGLRRLQRERRRLWDECA